MKSITKKIRMFLLALVALSLMCTFAVGMGMWELNRHYLLMSLSGIGWILAVLALNEAINLDTSSDTEEGAQIVLKTHRGVTRNIGKPMPLDDAMKVAYAMSDGTFILHGIHPAFFVPAYRCPGGTLFLLRVGQHTTTTTQDEVTS